MHHWLPWIENHADLIGWLVAGSVVMFFGTLLLVPVIVVRIPQDYFAHEHRPQQTWMPNHPVLRLFVIFVKNSLGAVLLLVGVALLVLPGQGILTMLIGLMLMDFPGKYRLEKWLVRKGPTLRGLNWLRRKAGREPFDVAG
ncbi:hypothetical protein NG895_18885 [Aeoliella sp. ICT_H6.2]|uniref:Transmembrane protein (PGPGW) n=1 Tax=Aeoliella straminimaris TaxID=2954799 RepID=A0A9X2JHE5_9BACT|nr:PGPGW domain-containing protein [Aeoliella straminimaris]MCO6045970.1 hypothetical protein [Aeoliella straminimaris]